MRRDPNSIALRALAVLVVLAAGCSKSSAPVNPGAAPASNAFTDYRGEIPGKIHKITLQDLPAPFATASASNGPTVVPRPKDAWPRALPGFRVELYSSAVQNPRLIRTAPNGDLFVAESGPGEIKILRGIRPDGTAETASTFAAALNKPFGIAFYPPGPSPQYVYVANTNSVIRFPYQAGDLKARGPAQAVLPALPGGGMLQGGGHWTRDIAFSADGAKMFVSVGSRTNITNLDNPLKGYLEYHRADILQANPDGSGLRVYASGIRNAVGIAVDPDTGELWASVNERDALGDFLPPDYVTHIEENGFYGWPWYYTGGHEDPRLAGRHPELKAKAIVPDVLLEPHNASLELTFYQARQFPSSFQGNIFAAEHGSWNKAVRTGYEVICVPLRRGRSTGEYEDFLTGFITADGQVWGRPVGVAVAQDGSLMVSDDGSNSIWRVSYAGQ